MRLLSAALLVLVLLATTLSVALAARRISLLRAGSRRADTALRLRDVAAALVLDGEQPPPLSREESDLLPAVLYDFSRQITGSGRDEIAEYFERIGLVDRQLANLASRRAWRRAQAAYVLGDTCSGRAVGPLVERLADPSADVRTAATRSLGRLRAVSAAGPIVEAMAERRIPILLAGAVLLELSSGAGPHLVVLLQHPDPRARASGVELLSILGTYADTARLVPLLDDAVPAVRAETCRALGRLGDDEITTEVSNRLRDPEPEVRAAAAEALGELQEDTALPVLLAQAVTDHFDPARAAAIAAARIDPEAVAVAAARPDTSAAHLAEAAGPARVARR